MDIHLAGRTTPHVMFRASALSVLLIAREDCYIITFISLRLKVAQVHRVRKVRGPSCEWFVSPYLFQDFPRLSLREVLCYTILASTLVSRNKHVLGVRSLKTS